MHHRHAAGEPGVDPLQCLRSQGYLGDHEYGLAALLYDLIDGPQVDLGFAAAGDAVKQETSWLKLRVVQRLGYIGQRLGLRGGQSMLLSAGNLPRFADSYRVGPHPLHGDQPLAEQSLTHAIAKLLVGQRGGIGGLLLPHGGQQSFLPCREFGAVTFNIGVFGRR